MVTLRHIAITVAACAAGSLAALAEDEAGAGTPSRHATAERRHDLNAVRAFQVVESGAVQNWPLANYELEQIRASITLEKTSLPK